MKNPIRTIDTIVVHENKDFLIIDFYAPTFLWNQIRRIVSALEKIGKTHLTLQQIRDALDHPEKKVDFQVAPPDYLFLKNVVYDFEFEYKQGYRKQLKDFENKIVAHFS